MKKVTSNFKAGEKKMINYTEYEKKIITINRSIRSIEKSTELIKEMLRDLYFLRGIKE